MPERDNHEWQVAETAWIAAAKRHSEHTARSYERAMRRFKCFVNKPLADVGGADVQAWLDALHDDGLSANTVNAYLSGISSFYKYCIHIHTTVVDGREQGLTTYNPTTRVKRDTVQKFGTVRALTLEEMSDLLEQPDRNTETGARDYAILLMAFLTGRRNSEIRNLRWRDIQAGGHRYHWRGKRAKERTDELPAPAWAAIINYQRVSGRVSPRESDPVFSSVRFPRQTLSSQYLAVMTASYARDAGIRGTVTFHMLRHTYASIQYETGGSLGDIMRALAHESLDTTRVYIDQLAASGGQWEALWSALQDVKVSSEGTAKLPVSGVCEGRGHRAGRNVTVGVVTGETVND